MEKKILHDDPADVALFLKEATFLDKTMIGDYLGDKKDFNLQVLDCYVKMMNFVGMQFDVALRKFMGEGFRLPGEAQKIDRIMEKFAYHYWHSNTETFATAGLHLPPQLLLISIHYNMYFVFLGFLQMSPTCWRSR